MGSSACRRRSVRAFALVALLGGWPLSNAHPAQSSAPAARIVSPADRELIGSVVREYLLEHPELIQEVLRILIEREQAARNNARKQALALHSQYLFADPAAPASGNPRGDVTIVEFMDYRCPHCRRMRPTLAALIAQDRNVRVVYRDFPVLGPQSVFAARVALAAHRQGKYEAVHTALLETDVADESAVKALAARFGLNAPRLLADMNHPEVLEAINRNVQVATSLGIAGTPAFIIGDTVFPGAVDLSALASAVARTRAQKGRGAM